MRTIILVLLATATANVAAKDEGQFSIGLGSTHVGIGANYTFASVGNMSFGGSAGCVAFNSSRDDACGVGVTGRYFFDDSHSIHLFAGLLDEEADFDDLGSFDNVYGANIGYRYSFYDRGESGFAIGFSVSPNALNESDENIGSIELSYLF